MQGSQFQRTPKQWLTSVDGDRQSKCDAIKKVRPASAPPRFRHMWQRAAGLRRTLAPRLRPSRAQRA